MDLAALQRNWDTFGRRDPFWAILTDPAKRGNRWVPAEFFETGRVEIADHLAHAARLGVPRRRGRALDFGCGAGRLTQALADHFDTAIGVDVAPSMIALARDHNRHGERCTYAVNGRPDLTPWPDASFDLIYTSRVLQHIEPRYSTAYLREFVRLLAPGGSLSFDLPSASGDTAAHADGSVPTSAMRARITVTTDREGPVAPGESIRCQIRVTNLSDTAWHDASGHALNVGNHWLAADGTLLRQDDARMHLPAPLAAGAEAPMAMTLNAPTTPGNYRLQFDVVQEGVAWFASCGSMPAEVPVTVAARDRRGAPVASPTTHIDVAHDSLSTSRMPGPVGDELEPVMEMHAVPRERVEAILGEAGGRILDVRRVHHCGPMWLAFRYDVTR